MSTKTLLFLSKGRTAPSTRYRAMAYFEWLRAAGWRPIHQSLEGLAGRILALRKTNQALTIVVLRRTFAPPFLFLLRLAAQQLIFDLDDAIFLKSDGSQGSGHRQQRFFQMVRCCDQVWAGNRYLAEQALAYNPQVYQLPTSVNLSLYRKQPNTDSNHLDLVWIGSHSTSKYLRWILPTLEAAARQFPMLRLKVVADFALQSPYLPIINIPWARDTEAQALVDSHIGIAPMPDDPWTRGKCGLKILQYMAAGLPVISSPHGANAEIVAQGKFGLLADGPTEWLAALQQLATPETRIALGQQGRQHCADHYSTEVTYRKMAILLSKMESIDER